MKTKNNSRSKPVQREQPSENSMKTDLKYIQKLVKMLETSNLSEIEIEEQGVKLRVAKNPFNTSMFPMPQMQYSMPMPTMPGAVQQSGAAEKITEAKKEEKTEDIEEGKNLIEAKSPIVGTFYRAPSPTADPYVQVGTVVSKGTVLCIIEAMKLMNEIESDYDGKIVKIMVDNAKPVEYNQNLFLIEPL